MEIRRNSTFSSDSISPFFTGPVIITWAGSTDTAAVEFLKNWTKFCQFEYLRYHNIYWDLTRCTEISQDLLIWHYTFDIWYLTFVIWRLTFDMPWHLTLIFHEIWHLSFISFNLTLDIRHLTFDIDIPWHCYAMTFDIYHFSVLIWHLILVIGHLSFVIWHQWRYWQH